MPPTLGNVNTGDAASTGTEQRSGRGWATGGSRVRSIDTMRGIVLAVMILTPAIRYPGTYPLLDHASWFGWTVSDLVFPLFLFVGGLSLFMLVRGPVSRKKRIRLVRRFVALLLLGVVYNAIGGPLDLSSIRLTGVLQLIGISGGVAALVVLLSRRRDGTDRVGIIWGAAAALVGTYGAILVWSPGTCDRYEVDCNPTFWFDQAVLGRSHLYRPFSSSMYDPEGLIVSIAAASIVLVGYLTARYIASRDPQRSAIRVGLLGAAGLAIALLLDSWLPISKRLLTPTFVLLSVSIGAIVFAVLVLTFDVDAQPPNQADSDVRRWIAWPFVVLGANALVVFFAERILLTAARETSIGGEQTGTWMLDALGGAPSAALVISFGMLLVIVGLAAVMWRKGWRVVL